MFNLLQVSCSAEMEVFSLKSILNFLIAVGVKIETVVTDRSTSVRSMLQQDFPDISHQFDIWYKQQIYFIFVVDKNVVKCIAKHVNVCSLPGISSRGSVTGYLRQQKGSSVAVWGCGRNLLLTWSGGPLVHAKVGNICG